MPDWCSSTATLEFRHPLVRSAVYGSASGQRAARRSHGARGRTRGSGPRAWHAALVSDDANERIAIQLDAAQRRRSRAGRMRPRRQRSNGQVSSARTRAEGAPSRVRGSGRGRRRPSAAALALADRAQQLIGDRVDAGELNVVRAIISMRQGTPAQTFSLARSAATALAEQQPDTRAADGQPDGLGVESRGLDSGWSVRRARRPAGDPGRRRSPSVHGDDARRGDGVARR